MYKYLIKQVVLRMTCRRDMLRQRVQPVGRGETVCDNERAEIQEFPRHDGRLLRRNHDTRREVTLLADDAQQRLGQFGRAARLRFR